LNAPDAASVRRVFDPAGRSRPGRRAGGAAIESRHE
jgi:hypothetical protein